MWYFFTLDLCGRQLGTLMPWYRYPAFYQKVGGDAAIDPKFSFSILVPSLSAFDPSLSPSVVCFIDTATHPNTFVS
jgi:hypothetical protein